MVWVIWLIADPAIAGAGMEPGIGPGTEPPMEPAMAFCIGEPICCMPPLDRPGIIPDMPDIAGAADGPGPSCGIADGAETREDGSSLLLLDSSWRIWLSRYDFSRWRYSRSNARRSSTLRSSEARACS